MTATSGPGRRAAVCCQSVDAANAPADDVGPARGESRGRDPALLQVDTTVERYTQGRGREDC